MDAHIQQTCARTLAMLNKYREILYDDEIQECTDALQNCSDLINRFGDDIDRAGSIFECNYRQFPLDDFSPQAIYGRLQDLVGEQGNDQFIPLLNRFLAGQWDPAPFVIYRSIDNF